MLWGLAWYWYAVIGGLLIPWVATYRDVRDAFDDGLKSGPGVWLGVSAFTVPGVLVVSFLLRLAIWR